MGWRPIGSASSSCPTTPKFAAKLKDVVGLYVDPPAHAVVLSLDEKSQIVPSYRLLSCHSVFMPSHLSLAQVRMRACVLPAD